MLQKDNRPIFLDLFKIHFPVTAIVSILHRISGIVLFLGVPVGLYLLDYSTLSIEHFKHIQYVLIDKSWMIQLILSVLTLCASFHLICGIKHLLTDCGIGKSLLHGQQKAWFVIISTVLVTVFILFNYIL